MICAKSAVKKDGKAEKFAKKEESEEIEEITSVSTISSVSIHIGRPSSTGSCVVREEQGEEIDEIPSSSTVSSVSVHIGSLSSTESSEQNFGTSVAVSSSVEALGNEADDELSSETSSFLSEDECDLDYPQEDALCKRVKSFLPRNVRNHGIGQENDDRSDSLASVENPTVSSSQKNERQLKKAGDGGDNARIWARECPGPSSLHSMPNTLLPPPRPSQQNQACSKKLKGKEQLAEEKLKRRPWGFWKKKRARCQEDEMHANKVRLIKKIKNAIKRKAAQEPDNGATAVPPDETIAQMFGVTIEDCRDSSSNKSSSTCSPASTSTSSSSSWDSSVTTDDDRKDPGTDDYFGDVESANTPEDGAETRSRATASRRTFVISKRGLQKPRTGLPCIGEEATSERFRNGQESVETKPPSANNWDSWDSSTASDEEIEKPNVSHSDRKVESTSESHIKDQTVAAKSPRSTNSWNSSTTSVSDDRPCTELQSLRLESASSWKSSSISDEDVQRLSTPEIQKIEDRNAKTWSSSSPSCSSSISSDDDVEGETLKSSNNGKKKTRSIRRWFRFRRNKVVPL